MSRKHRFESKALRFTYDRYVGQDPKKQVALEEALASSEVARQIYDLRTTAGLTQARLAARVGTSVSAISRLEDADYDGHSLGMLRRIAAAMNRRVEVKFVPVRKRAPLPPPTSRRAPAAKANRALTQKAAARKKSAA